MMDWIIKYVVGFLMLDPKKCLIGFGEIQLVASGFTFNWVKSALIRIKRATTTKSLLDALLAGVLEGTSVSSDTIECNYVKYHYTEGLTHFVICVRQKKTHTMSDHNPLV